MSRTTNLRPWSAPSGTTFALQVPVERSTTLRRTHLVDHAAPLRREYVELRRESACRTSWFDFEIKVFAAFCKTQEQIVVMQRSLLDRHHRFAVERLQQLSGPLHAAMVRLSDLIELRRQVERQLNE